MNFHLGIKKLINCYRKIKKSLRLNTLLNLIDIAIFDYLIQNGDRHRYEVYKDRVVILDNGKGLGNPMVDVIDILAPLYQCCMLVCFILLRTRCCYSQLIQSH